MNIRPHNQTNFFYTFFFVFIPSSRISINMCKWRHKLQNVKKSVGSVDELKLDLLKLLFCII